MKTRTLKSRVPLSVADTALVFSTRTPKLKHSEYYSLPIDRAKHVRRVAPRVICAPEHLPPRFVQAIELSRSLLNLAADWDGDDAEPIALQTWTRATEFLKATLVRSGATGSVPVPNISPCRDGSIDLFWSRGSFRLLINIKPAGCEQSDYYGETTDGFVVKGTFDPARHDLSAVLRLLSAA